MIDVKELRIGNWIKYKEISYQIKRANDLDSIYDPIPLTTEIFEKCGFIVKDDNPKQKPHYYGDVLVTILGCNWSNSAVEGFATYDLIPGHLVKIKHLHQLQNLFFSLSGKELNYTP